MSELPSVDDEDDWPVERARPAWVRVVALIAASALVLPLVIAAVELLF